MRNGYHLSAHVCVVPVGVQFRHQAVLPPRPQSATLAERALRDAARELSRRPASSEQDGVSKKEGGTPITVCVRVRPLNASERDAGSAWTVKVRPALRVIVETKFWRRLLP
jgi:hypothetical protein